jgi:hypothetical protein
MEDSSATRTRPQLGSPIARTSEVFTLEDHLFITQYILAFVRILQVIGSANQNLQSILLTLVLDHNWYFQLLVRPRHTSCNR